MLPLQFAALWSFAQKVGKSRGEDPESVFDPIGLLLYPEGRRPGYEETPENALAFAYTGGDGVHFSFLEVEGMPAASPVVMTVPGGIEGRQNIILGETLFEFLALGCRFGYFALEQLSYHPAETLADLQAGQPADEDLDVALLSGLAAQFKLKPWPTVKKRLRQLEKAWGPSVRGRVRV